MFIFGKIWCALFSCYSVLRFALLHYYPFKRQSHNMVKHTQTIRRQFTDELFECVWTFCKIGAKRVIQRKIRFTCRISFERNNLWRSVRIQSYSGLYFPAFRLNTERYSVSLRIQSECGKIWTGITPNTDTFYAVEIERSLVKQEAIIIFHVILLNFGI